MVTLEQVKGDKEVICYIEAGNEHLGAMGYTDHSFRHVEIVSSKASEIAAKLGMGVRQAELAGIAGYLHDLGNVVSRYNHSQSGALLSAAILTRLGMDCRELVEIIGAIGNHDEGEGEIVNELTAVLVLADKTDVHRSRVRNKDFATFDIHDRVNYAVEESELEVDPQNRRITLHLTIDIKIVPVIEYFEIFMLRLMMCRRAAAFINCEFVIMINKARLL